MSNMIGRGEKLFSMSLVLSSNMEVAILVYWNCC